MAGYVHSAFLQSVAIIVALLLVIAFVWWHFTGWTEFSYQEGDLPSWAPTGSRKNISRLRFKNCVFSVQRAGDASPTARDVTSVLNSMAVAYSRSTSRSMPAGNFPKALTLDRPLNAFSFVIPAFNDAYYLDSSGTPRGTVKDPSAAPWCGAGGPAPAACSAAAECRNLPQFGACSRLLGGRFGAECGSDADCGGVAGACNQGICAPPSACTGVAAIANRQTGAACSSDYDCDSVAGSCVGGRCVDSPAVEGVCRNCASDADCGGVAGSCSGYSPGPDPVNQPCAVTLGICSLCPGGAAVTLTGLVRAI